ncbi:MAG TPA: ABC transporter ATP-binding protein [Spirochaetota bacterium]|nr:ABC transporter ATP-binding protein [Spirochaetota bacterium]HPS85633.1 ABC transporter ATP-binding protein [Spirochaetota bacterium]
MIEIKGLEKSYGTGRNSIQVLRGIDLSITKGDSVSITGPSGTGKSTLLNMIGCLDNFDKGSLKLTGRDVSSLSVDELSSFRNRHIGFIFQLHNLLPEFTALENVMIPLLIRRTPAKKAREISMELLKKFKMEDRAGHKPGEMSGGECQRIAVARAIAGEPDLILADEPTGSLDSRNSMILLEILLDLCKDKGSTIIIVTHDMKIAGLTQRKISMLDGVIVDNEDL